MKGIRGCNYLLRAKCTKGPMDIKPYIHQRYCSREKGHEANHRTEIRCGGIHRALDKGFEIEKAEDQTDSTDK